MKTTRKTYRNGTRRAGFSLSEMLIVVAIIGILSAVGFVNGADMLRRSRQTAMDRQAEQIFLALSRNLQGLEASGNVAFLADTVRDTCDNHSWVIQVESPQLLAAGSYALYQSDENREDDDFKNFKKLLFPQDGVSAALSADLENGFWLVLFTPGMDSKSDITKDVDGTSVKVGTEARNVRPAVQKVFFAKNEETAKRYFEQLLRHGGDMEADPTATTVKNGVAYYSDETDGRKNRLNELDGHVGYYGGENQSLMAMTNKRYSSFQCGISKIENTEKLSVSVWCNIPENPSSPNRPDPEYSYPIRFRLKLKGEISGEEGGEVELIQEIPKNRVSKGKNEATFILDQLGAESLKTVDKPNDTRKWKQILESSHFVPGEDLQLTLTVECNIYRAESNTIEAVNSLFAEGTTLDKDTGTLEAKIAYGRHLQNLNRGTSGVGKDSRVSAIKAVQKQDIYFSGAYPDTEEFNSADKRWADTYVQENGTSKTFLPILSQDENRENDKLVSYDGGGHSIYHLAVDYENENIAAKWSANQNGNRENAGLFGTFGGSEIKNLTLVEPVITGTDGTKNIGGFAGVCKAATLQNLTLIDPTITGADGVTEHAGGLAGTLSMGGDTNITQCALYLTTGNGSMTYQAVDNADTPENGMLWLATGTGEKRYAGGLVGLAEGSEKTLTIAQSFASTVIKAGVKTADDLDNAVSKNSHAGGLVGMANDKVTVSIKTSYAGSYLFGDYTGGLVGGTGTDAFVTVTSSYAAGFQLGNESAGLLYGAGSIDHAYTVSAALKDDLKYPIAPDTVTVDSNSVCKRTNFADPWYHAEAKVRETLGDTFTSWISIDLGKDEESTYPYNLKKQSLLNYTYPRLNIDWDGEDANFLRVYHGDWKPELGVLAYYEVYHYDHDSDYYKTKLTDEQKLNGEYRFTVEALNCLKDDNELRADRGKITADGYGILFEAKVVSSDSLKYLGLSFGGVKGSGENIEPGEETPEFKVPNDDYKVIEIGGIEYNLYPIASNDTDKINRNLHSDDPDIERTFYQWAKIKQKDAGGEKESYYTFNPHFAMTPHMFPDPKPVSMTWENIRDRYLVFQTKQTEIPVRTARQLYNLSKYYETDYYSILKDNGRNVTFKQECDIDYRAYDWKDYAPQYLPDGGTDWKTLVNWQTYATQSTYYETRSQDRGPESDGSNGWDKAAFTQRPIAENQGKPFVNVYNGGCHVITGLSVMASMNTGGGEKAVGLFGWNEGQLDNIVLAAPFDRDDANSPYVVGRKQDIGYNRNKEEVYIGVLAGYNNGAVSNCAVAGYSLSMSGDMRDPSTVSTNATDSNQLRVLNVSTLYAGGVVGKNDTNGTIRNTSSSAPRIFTYIHLAHAYTGGFAGWNDGEISYAYSIGWVDAESSPQTSERGYTVSLAGFCAGSKGTHSIRDSYCAVPVTGAGTFTTNGFAPSMVQVQSSYYLYGPVAKYLDKLHNYDAPSDRARPCSESQLRKLAVGKTVETAADGQRGEYWHDMPASEQALGYLYPAYVTDRNGKRCHYGNWLEKQSLGQMGMFYWEKEEGGSNSGYHISFLGVHYDDQKAQTTPITGSTLCISHNDGGVIKTYGYGYYAMKGKSVTPRPDQNTLQYSGTKHNADARAKLAEQWPDYIFYPYTTRTPKQAGSDGEEDYIWMSGGKANGSDNVQNGSMKLTLYGNPTLTGEYELSPFFANALRIKTITGTNVNFSAEDCTTTAKVLKDDGSVEQRTKNFHAELGKADNRYEIRSLRQLQYINWNYYEKNTTTLVTEDNKDQFNYLTYWSGKANDNNSVDTEEKIDTSHTKNVKNFEPSNCYWWQTHDAVAPASGLTTPVEEGGALFTPIAGATISSGKDNYNSRILAWFGGHFDGQSYTLKNFEIHSDSFTVGVFGATVSAEIQNVILYSDGYNVIERVTRPEDIPDGQVKNKVGAYLLGGMIGLAYAYNPANNKDPVTNKELVIYNCAISGYQIVDSSTNPGGLGDANIGGLLGAAYATIKNCSSVVDIRINCEYTDHAAYGSYMRAGGLVGAIQYKAENCYSGGNVYIGEYADGRRTNTLYEMDMSKVNFTTALLDPENKGEYDYYWVKDKKKPQKDDNIQLLSEYLQERKERPDDEQTIMLLYRREATNIYVGGIAGSTFGAEYLDFTGSGRDRQAEFVNCYTYMNLPKIEGNIRAVSYMGNVADRYGTSANGVKSKVTQINCYYLNGISPDANEKEGATARGETYVPAFPFNLNWYTTLDSNQLAVLDETGQKIYDPVYKKDGTPDLDSNGVQKTKLRTTSCKWGEEYPGETVLDEEGKIVREGLMNIEGETVNPEGITGDNLDDILNGNISSLKKIQYNDEDTNTPEEYWVRCAKAPNLPNGQSYETMTKTVDGDETGTRYKLNGSKTDGVWTPVTTQIGTAEVEGRYSFPGKDYRLLGADYPFPTVIKQYDPVSGEAVSVHYGPWPLDGAYWQAYMETLDIFGDMNKDSDGPDGGWWAEKEFTLCNVKDAPTNANFVCGDESIAEVIGDPEAVKTHDDGTTDYKVTIRAKRRGNVEVVYKYTKTVIITDDSGNPVSTEVEQERKFNLTVTASGIETGGTFEPGTFEPDGQKTLSFATDKDSTTAGDVIFELYAKNEAGLYFTKSVSDWENTGTGRELNKALPVQNGSVNFLTQMSGGELVEATGENESGNLIRYTARTNGTPGEYYVSSTFTYDYHGLSLPIHVTTESLYTFGTLGLSNSEPYGFSHAKRVSGTNTPDVTDRPTFTTTPDYPDPWNSQHKRLFLYETATDAVKVPDGDMVPALQALDIDPKGIRLTDALNVNSNRNYQPYPLKVTLGDKTWYVMPSEIETEESRVLTEEAWEAMFKEGPDFFNPAVGVIFYEDVVCEEGSDYQYRGIRVQHLHNEPLPADLKLTIPVKDPNPELSDAVYTLSTTIVGIGEGVDYSGENEGGGNSSGGGTGDGGESDTPGGGNSGEGGGNSSSGGTGDSGSPVNYYNYSVTLYPNEGTVTTADGHLIPETGWRIYSKYIEGQFRVTLPYNKTDAHPYRENYEFTGWNTASDGSGTPYFKDDATTDTISADLNLYAQWRLKECKIYLYESRDDILSNEKPVIYNPNPSGESILLHEQITLPTPGEGELDEWNIPFFLGWMEYKPGEGDELTGNVCTFWETGEKYFYPKAMTEIPLQMNFNVNGTETREEHFLTLNDDNTLSLDAYQNPEFPDNVTRLGWYTEMTDSAMEILRLVDEDGKTPLSAPRLMLTAQELYALYREKQTPLDLYLKCRVYLPKTETIADTTGDEIFGTHWGTDNEDGYVEKEHTFIESVQDVSFEAGDILTISMTLHGYNPDEKDGVKQNLVSIGTMEGALDYHKGILGIHFSYPRNANNRFIRAANSASFTWDTSNPLRNFVDENARLTITVSKDGIKLEVREPDGTVKTNQKAPDGSKTFNSLLGNWEGENKKLYIASWDGVNRSLATDYVITLTRELNAEGRQISHDEFDYSALADSTTVPQGDSNTGDADGTDAGDTTNDNGGDTGSMNIIPISTGGTGETDTTNDNASSTGDTTGEHVSEPKAAQAQRVSEADAAPTETVSEADAAPTETVSEPDAAPSDSVSGTDATVTDNVSVSDSAAAPSDNADNVDDDASLYGWTAPENPENELPQGWNSG